MAKLVSFKPSGSRWAVLAFGVAFAMFFVVGSGILPINPTVHPLAISCVSLGGNYYFCCDCYRIRLLDCYKA
jgi:hypothetical protein